MTELLPAARRVRDQLTTNGQALTRAALAEALRSAGHTVSNTRISELLKILKAESSAAPTSKEEPTSPAAIPAPRPPSSQQRTADAAGQLGAAPTDESRASRTHESQTEWAGEPES